MKRSLFMAGALLCGMAVFTSCEKEESASDVNVDLLKTATIKGYLYGEIDQSNDKIEKLSGKTVNITISNDELLMSEMMNIAKSASMVEPIADRGTFGYWTTSVTTDANGVFEVTVPVNDNGVYVYIQPVTFEATVPQLGANVAPKKKYFDCNSYYRYVKTGEFEIFELTYSSDELDVQ